MQQREFDKRESIYYSFFIILWIRIIAYYNALLFFCTVDKFNFQVRSSSVVGSVVKNFCEKLANYIISTVSTTLEHQSILTVY